jgi:hypothetical protein
MLSKRVYRFSIGIALALILGLMTSGFSLAAGPTGSSPSAPLAVSNGIRHLDVGGQDWYAFTSAGQDSNNDPSHVLILLRATPAGSATFKVWTAEGLREKATENSDHLVYPMGQGTVLQYKDGDQTLDRYGGDLVWHNGFKVGGTFYVQVGQTGSTASDYVLTITGDNISFPGTPAASAARQVQVAPAATNPAIPAAMVPGSGMDTAMTPTGQAKTLNPGERQWYMVTLSREAKDEDKQNLQVELNAPADSAKFVVWTAERLAQRAGSDNPDKDAPPVGQGTKASYKDGDQTLNRFNGNLFWSGDASYGGTFYIVVESTSSAPIQYVLNTSIAQR